MSNSSGGLRDAGPPNGQIVAEITPRGAPESPTFRMLTDVERWQRDRETVSCPHTGFVLDDKKRTVECGECGARIDAYEALRHYAEWYVAIERKHRNLEYTEVQALEREARVLSRQKRVSDADRAELDAFSRRGIPGDCRAMIAEGSALLRRVNDARRLARVSRDTSGVGGLSDQETP